MYIFIHIYMYIYELLIFTTEAFPTCHDAFPTWHNVYVHICLHIYIYVCIYMYIHRCTYIYVNHASRVYCKLWHICYVSRRINLRNMTNSYVRHFYIIYRSHIYVSQSFEYIGIYVRKGEYIVFRDIYIHVYIHMHIYIYINIYIYVCMYMNIYI